MIWTVVLACLFLAGYVFMRVQRREENKPTANDTGLAILEFGRAYPNEAIRAVIRTANGESAFFRLHDGKVGCTRVHGKHVASYLIEPGTVRVHNAESGKGLALEFVDNVYERGSFEFHTSADAAEVSLWLLGSLVPEAGIDEAPASISGER